MTPEEGQKQIDEWFNNLPVEIDQLYSFLTENVKKFQTFDLLSYFSYYNHLHDSEKYSDLGGDKNFFVSEVLALLCLKSDFVNHSTVSENDYMELIMEMQKTVLYYCGRTDALEMIQQYKQRGEDTVSDIAAILSREAKHIRNPGHPEHHLIFTEKLFEPIKSEVKSLLGFSISDSIAIRKKLPDMINKKCRVVIDEALEKGKKHAKEVIRFRKTRIVESESIFTKEQLKEYSKYSDKKIKVGLQEHFLNELYYTFGKTYTFTANELSDFTSIDLEEVNAFLKTFSCGFPSLRVEEKIYTPITILKNKPIIEHGERYLIPSFPLLIWAVEEFIFDKYFSNKVKSNTSISDLRHDFVLEEGYEYFKKMLPTATFLPLNLKYHFEGKSCETDGLIIYDRLLFIIEAKGHRITSRSKEGDRVRTQRHLNEIVKQSFEQGYRTIRYLSANEVSEFKPKKSKWFYLNNKDFDEILIISLTLEPIGNMSMVIKATNDIGFFQEGHFPWIISIYDLVVLADLFENPLMFIHYIKRRKKFLSHKTLSTYEELDLVSCFLSNGLIIEHTLKDADETNVSWIEFMPDTDEINDYYMYKFGHKTKFTPKPKCYISREFNDFLLQLDHSRMPNRVRMALLVLEFNNKSIKQLIDSIKKTKNAFANDKRLHDCSIYTHSFGGIGVTYMTGINEQELDFKLHQYCTYKLHQQNSYTWIGFGDVSTDRNVYSFQVMFFAIRGKID